MLVMEEKIGAGDDHILKGMGIVDLNLKVLVNVRLSWCGRRGEIDHKICDMEPQQKSEETRGQS